MNLAARRAKLAAHLRAEGVTDAKVLRAFEKIPRERFVPSAFREHAYDDTALPIGEGQTISQPWVVAHMTEALQVGDRHKVLEVGTGSGYQAAILSLLCRRVFTIERHRSLLDSATKLFVDLRLFNITTIPGDGTRGWPEQAPFDRIIVTAGGVGDAPKDLTDQLAVGGIMLIPLGGPDFRDQRIVRITRTAEGLSKEDLWPVRFVPLVSDSPMPFPQQDPER